MAASPTRTFLEGLAFGEAPRWHDGRLWYSDFFTTAVWSVGEEGGVPTRELAVPGRPSGLGWLPDGRLLVVSMQQRAVLRREPDGEVVVHADLGRFVTHVANDLLVLPDGRAYVGQFGFDLEGFFDGTAPAARTSLLSVGPDGAVDVAADELDFPNGMAVCGSTLVVAESFGARLSAFDITGDGRLAGRRVWAALEHCAPDGICADAEGAVWVANAVAPECLRVAEGGQVLERVVTGQTCFACALGGRDGTTLFCCTAPTGRDGPRTASREARIETTVVTVPGAGST